MKPKNTGKKLICDVCGKGFGTLGSYGDDHWWVCLKCFEKADALAALDERPWQDAAQPIATVADLVRLTEPELLREPNFGRKSLAAIKRVLAEHGLTLGMGV
jgi:hypothetical protein